MKRLIAFSLLALSLGACGQKAVNQDLRGAQVMVPGWQWVPDELGEKGDVCAIEFSGTLTVIEVRNETTVQVMYEPPTRDIWVVNCRPATRYLMKTADFRAMNRQYVGKINEILETRANVAKILALNYYGEVVDAGEWQWVTFIPLRPLTRDDLNFGDICGIGNDYTGGAGGTIQARSNIPGGKNLYEYTASGETAGTQCPSEVLFFK